jgi:hypothetical protein
MKKSLIIILAIILSAGVFNACKKNKGEPPVLPSSESMAIDFSNFGTGKKSASEISYPKGTETSSWEFAAGVAFVWNTIIYTTLAVPVKAFQLAANTNPTYIDSQTWQWNYNATVLNVSYKARLTGQIGTSNVQWKMYITREGTGGFNEFLWFQGTSDFDGTQGQWILNLSPQNNVQVVQIDWSKPGETTGTIKFTYIKSGDPFKDSYIEYGLTSNTLNAYYNIHYYNSTYQQFYDVNVEWSTTQHNGRVKCPAFFGNSDWYCWDGNYINVTCS